MSSIITKFLSNFKLQAGSLVSESQSRKVEAIELNALCTSRG